MTLKEMIKAAFSGNRKKAAQACGTGISVENLNQCVSRGYSVQELKDGGFVMITEKTKIFKERG